MKNKVIISVLILIILVLVGLFCYCISDPFKNAEFEQKDKYREADYVHAYCKGIEEYVLPDRTRVDCLTDDYAIEFDWAKKWAESIGQSLYYAKMTGKKPAVALIIKSDAEKRYVERINKVDKGIMVFVIKARDFKK